jgi:hypothetical protein
MKFDSAGVVVNKITFYTGAKQTFLMAFSYSHAEMTIRRGQKMVNIFLFTYDILKINSLSGDAINPGLNDI